MRAAAERVAGHLLPGLISSPVLQPAQMRAARAPELLHPVPRQPPAAPASSPCPPRQVIETIEKRLPPESRRELHLLLRLLGSRWGSLLLLGRASVG